MEILVHKLSIDGCVLLLASKRNDTDHVPREYLRFTICISIKHTVRYKSVLREHVNDFVRIVHLFYNLLFLCLRLLHGYVAFDNFWFIIIFSISSIVLIFILFLLLVLLVFIFLRLLILLLAVVVLIFNDSSSYPFDSSNLIII